MATGFCRWEKLVVSTELLYEKNFLLDGQTRQVKLSLQPVNRPFISGHMQGLYHFSETNFQDFSRTEIDFSRALKFTLNPMLPRSQC